MMVMKKLMRGERVIIKKRGRGPKPPGGCTVIYCSLALAFKKYDDTNGDVF